MPKKSTTEEFINKSRIKHDDKYDYSLVNYINSSSKVEIICNEHGIFNQSPNNHLKGAGCPSCCGLIKPTTGEFIEKAKKIHGNKYDYSLTKYINIRTNVKIICKIHGVFEQLSNSHLNGKGCAKCTGKNKTTDIFITECKKVHDYRYDYSLVDYKTSNSKISIICKKHGLFEQLANDHLRGRGCPSCSTSKGEQIITDYLTDNDILFEPQKTFKGCVYKNKLKFDFYLSEQNICIEYDGRQHYDAIDYFGGDVGLKKTQLRDKIKDDYCANNNISILRLRYDEDILLSLENLKNDTI